MTRYVIFVYLRLSKRQLADARWPLIRMLLALILLGCNLAGQAQQFITGRIVDAATHKPLAYVNIGINTKNIGTISTTDGSFSLRLPTNYRNDTLTFSLVGYVVVILPINKLIANPPLTIALTQRILTLNEVNISGHKLVEKKFGIKNRNLLVHFTDGMFLKQDIFEIGQVIKLGDYTAQITSVNLFINAPRKDSASFRINFYRLKDDRPADRLVEKSIIQRHPVREGWLRFDLTEYNLLQKGSFMVALELIPEKDSLSNTPINYEVKLGGSSRSFYRRNSLGQWNTPPHHYCLYLTALVNKSTPESAEDEEAKPIFSYRSNSVQDSFHIFVRLPADYHQKTNQRFPVLYHLDGNAYFDHISYSLEQLMKKNKLRIEPIVVGIGYRNAYEMDSLRVRDYTYPTALPSDSFPVSGGGTKFYSFIKNELIPEIEKRYRVDSTHRTLVGHSFGGYFAMLALHKSLTGEPVFDHIVAASPSLSYHDYYLIRQFESLMPNATSRVKKLFLSFGGVEMGEYPAKILPKFIQLLQKNNAIQIQSKRYKHLEHMGTAVPSFEEGIEFVLGR